MNKLQKLYYRIFYKDCKFEDVDYYGFFTNGERLHGIILGHNPILVWNSLESRGHYACNGCSHTYNQPITAEELMIIKERK